MGQLLLEGKSWDAHRVGMLEFHPAGLTSIFWSLPVAFPYSLSASETQNGFVVSSAQETYQQFRISPSLPTAIVWSFE